MQVLRTAALYHSFRRLCRRQNLRAGLVARLRLKVIDLGFDLRLELIAGTLEFIEGLAQLSTNFRHLLRPKNDQGQEEDKRHFSKTEIHTLIILRCSIRQQFASPEGSGAFRAEIKVLGLAPQHGLQGLCDVRPGAQTSNQSDQIEHLNYMEEAGISLVTFMRRC